ncbi:MAG: SDR family oxidoreductase [Coxiellaceae bacterium]|nr:SDR family oxidoreductase [Coxiellaceae bacterium]
MSLEGKKILIIGGSSGIGLAIAQAGLAQGAKVIIASRNKQKLAKANAALNNSAQTHAVDLTDESSIKSLFDTVGTIDHLQITGSEVSFGELDTLSIEDAKQSFDSKFWGAYLAVKIGHHHVSPDGSITLYSGGASQRPNKSSVALTALNSAVEGLGRALSVALSPIRVNVISPGITMTPLFEEMGQEVIDQVLETYGPNLLVKRYAEASEVAKTAAYLMDNAYVTGTIEMVNGGLSVT